MLEQDAAIEVSSGDTQVPGAAFFAGGIGNMALGLHSMGAGVEIKDPASVSGTALELTGKTSVTVDGSLTDLVSFQSTGATTLDGDITAQTDIVLNGATTLAAGNTTAPTDQTLTATGGKLTALAAITRTTAGNIKLQAGGDLTVATVTNSHQGGSLEIDGASSVTTGVLNTSGGSLPVTPSAGGAVTISSNGVVSVASVDSHGAGGLDEVKGSGNTATAGKDGGAIAITGSQITVGTLSAVAGPGGTSLGNPGTAAGGTGGKIALNTTGGTGVIGLSGNLIADGGAGGAGTSNDSTVPATSAPDGAAGDVMLNGAVQLLESRQTSDETDNGPTNVIRGNNVAISGGVTPGSVAGTPIAPGFTGLTVVAENSLTVGGNMQAGKLDLEVHNGNLTLGDTIAGQTQLSADVIRLAATDGPGKNTTGTVDLPLFTFTGADGVAPVQQFTVEQDASIGASEGGSPIIQVARLGGTPPLSTEQPLQLGLISQDGFVMLGADDIVNVQGTDLLLAANVAKDATHSPVEINGTLDVHKLTLGTATGIGGVVVGGETVVHGSLVIGTDSTPPTDPNNPDTGLPGTLSDTVLTALGSVSITGDATILGQARFGGSETQTLHSDGTLELKGDQISKTGTGDLVLDSQSIDLSNTSVQTIQNTNGAVLVNSPLVKEQGDLFLAGVTPDATTSGVVVKGTAPVVVDGVTLSAAAAVATKHGNLGISATTQGTAAAGQTPNTAQKGVGVYEVGGDLIANTGNLTLTGGAKLDGSKPTYTFQATQDANLTGGDLVVGGIASTDGDVRLIGESQLPNSDVAHPAAIHLSGNFNLVSANSGPAHGLIIDGDTEVAGDTSIVADGDVVFGALDPGTDLAGGSLVPGTALASGSRIEGAKNLDITSHHTVVLGDDVAMTAGSFAARGDSGVRFVSTSDSQSVAAGSISLGNGATSPPKGKGSLLRDGDLQLRASAGSVAVGFGQRMIVNGALSIQATGVTSLSDTAALSIAATTGELAVYGGSTIVSNSIQVTARPTVGGSGQVTFAVPNRTEISNNVPSDEVLVRAITPTGAPLAFAPTPLGEDFNPDFPIVNGAALFDYARVIPQSQPRAAITRPEADAFELAAALRDRPLWAEELVSYLETRSLESPNGSGRLPDAERLPPVGARPGEEIAPSDARVRSAAVESALAAYRDLFRAELRRDPESGVVEAPSQAPAIRAAFQAPIDAIRHHQSGSHAISGAELAKLVESSPNYTASRKYREQMSTLLDLGARALVEDQRPRFRALVLAEVTPYGISPAEFDSLFASN
ncbi:MAG: beta strand repeat-containing protein [Myxococcota bacterium]